MVVQCKWSEKYKQQVVCTGLEFMFEKVRILFLLTHVSLNNFNNANILFYILFQWAFSLKE